MDRSEDDIKAEINLVSSYIKHIETINSTLYTMNESQLKTELTFFDEIVTKYGMLIGYEKFIQMPDQIKKLDSDQRDFSEIYQEIKQIIQSGRFKDDGIKISKEILREEFENKIKAEIDKINVYIEESYTSRTARSQERA